MLLIAYNESGNGNSRSSIETVYQSITTETICQFSTNRLNKGAVYFRKVGSLRGMYVMGTQAMFARSTNNAIPKALDFSVLLRVWSIILHASGTLPWNNLINLQTIKAGLSCEFAIQCDLSDSRLIIITDYNL